MPPLGEYMSTHDPNERARGCHQGILRISYDVLDSALNLPEGTKIVGFSEHVFFSTNELCIKVEHEDLPFTQEAATLPEVDTNLKGKWLDY